MFGPHRACAPQGSASVARKETHLNSAVISDIQIISYGYLIITFTSAAENSLKDMTLTYVFNFTPSIFSFASDRISLELVRFGYLT